MRKALVVDDDERICQFIAFVLGERGFAVQAAVDARVALRLGAKTQFDVVVTDVLMPDMDGLDFIRALKAREPGLKILAISGGGVIPAFEYLENARLFGADGMLTKPFSGAQLVAAVEAVCPLKERYPGSPPLPAAGL